MKRTQADLSPAVARRGGKKPKPRRQRRKETLHYVIEIADWDWGFMFGVNPRKDSDEGPYSDYRHLELRGKLLRPASVKASEVEIILLPDARLNRSARNRDEPQSTGSFHISRGHLEFILPMPADALSDLLAMMIAGRFRFAVLEADRPHYGQGRVRHYRLASFHDKDDLPPDEQD